LAERLPLLTKETEMLALLLMAKRFLAERFHWDERGATAVEYGLIVALIAAVIVGTVALLGGDVLDGFDKVEKALP
jgi:pilus assembly protein Flp/PilA